VEVVVKAVREIEGTRAQFSCFTGTKVQILVQTYVQIEWHPICIICWGWACGGSSKDGIYIFSFVPLLEQVLTKFYKFMLIPVYSEGS
jgi:hypothetical protein